MIILKIELAYGERTEFTGRTGPKSADQPTNARRMRDELDKVYADACAWLERRREGRDTQ